MIFIAIITILLIMVQLRDADRNDVVSCVTSV